MIRVVHFFSTAIFFSLLPYVVWAQARYSITLLGPATGGTFTQARGINRTNLVVGRGDTVDGDRALSWQNGTVTVLAPLAGGSFSGATAVNNLGQAVGESDDASGNSYAVLWTNGVISQLPTLAGHDRAEALGVNDAQQVVGNAYGGSGTTAFLSNSGVTQAIGTTNESSAATINNNGQAVGTSSGVGFLWSQSGATNIGPLPGKLRSQPLGINDHAEVVGASEEPHKAFFWRNGVIAELPALPDSGFGPHQGVAWALNDLGQVVGYSNLHSLQGSTFRAVLWENGAVVDLNTQIPPDSAWVLNAAFGVNNDGVIVGEGYINGDQSQSFAFLLTPTAAPTVQQQLQTIVTQQITPLLSQGILASGDATMLTTTIAAATQSLNAGNTSAAAGTMRAFLNQVNALVRSGRLTAAQAAPLLQSGQEVLAKIRQM